MEKITQEIIIPKSKERFQKLKQIKDNLDKPNIPNKEISKYIKELIEFPDITSKEINVNF